MRLKKAASLILAGALAFGPVTFGVAPEGGSGSWDGWHGLHGFDGANDVKPVEIGPMSLNIGMNSAYAARGGARIGGGTRMAPPKAAPKTEARPDAGAKRPNQEYAPSKSAKEYNSTAPSATNSKPSARTAGSGWGGTLRNIGLLAGGMMLGSMLANMFGFGFGSLMADILGLVANVAILAMLFIAVRWAWRKFSGRGKKETRYEDMYRAETYRDVPRKGKIIDIKPPSGENEHYEAAGERRYDARSTADRYRSK